MVRRYLMIIVLLAALLCGCEDSLLIVGMEVVHYPDNIVYITGRDTELDLTGGVLLWITKDKSYLSEHPFTDVHVLENIDFNVPGVYPVILQWGSYRCPFSVQVVDPDELSERIG